MQLRGFSFGADNGGGGGGGGAGVLRVDYLTATSGTWLKDSNAKFVRIQAWGPGGSGNGGQQKPSGTDSRGGGGGASGAYVDITLPASEVPNSVSYAVGTPGAIGLGATVAGDNSPAASAGTNTTFGTLVTAIAGQAAGPDNAPGYGVSFTCFQFGVIHNNQNGGGGSSGTGGPGSTPGTCIAQIPTAGGGGGGLDTGTTQGAGGAGQVWDTTFDTLFPVTQAAGGAINGGDGGHGASKFGIGFGGGGGGPGSTDGTIRGGDGGNGGFPGGGGGGGGASRNGARGGNGGLGGAGLLIITQYG